MADYAAAQQRRRRESRVKEGWLAIKASGTLSTLKFPRVPPSSSLSFSFFYKEKKKKKKKGELGELDT